MTSPACWRCGAGVDAAFPRCAGCGALQPEAPGSDLFAVLGLARRQGIDAGELERRWRERSRQVHPDRFTRATPRERRIALERAARLNEAARVLRHPLRRAEYLVGLLAPGALEAERRAPGPSFLSEQLELREQCAEARAAGDASALQRLASAARARLAAVERELPALLDGAAPAPEQVRAAAALLARARYDEAVLDDAGAAPVREP